MFCDSFNPDFLIGWIFRLVRSSDWINFLVGLPTVVYVSVVSWISVIASIVSSIIVMSVIGISLGCSLCLRRSLGFRFPFAQIVKTMVVVSAISVCPRKIRSAKLGYKRIFIPDIFLTKVSFFGQCSKMQIIPIKNFIIKTCFN